MGNWQSYQKFRDPEYMPYEFEEPRFDPNYGVKGKRKERVMIATEQELRAAMIPKDKWDYCAHLLLEVYRCRADHFPLAYKCKEQVHAVSKCELDDYILRMKEYERDRRLLQRRKRRQENRRALEAAAA